MTCKHGLLNLNNWFVRLLSFEGQVSLAVEQNSSLIQYRLASQRNFYAISNLTKVSGIPKSTDEDSGRNTQALTIALQFAVLPRYPNKWDTEALRKNMETVVILPTDLVVIHNARHYSYSTNERKTFKFIFYFIFVTALEGFYLNNRVMAWRLTQIHSYVCICINKVTVSMIINKSKSKNKLNIPH